MTAETFKKYLKSLRFGGEVQTSAHNDIVDAAAEAAFGKVWEANIWKVGRRLDTSLTTTSGQNYTILPKDLSGIGSVNLILGTGRSRSIEIQDEGNFDYNFPDPSAWSNDLPDVAKLVYHGAQSNDKWRLYWFRIPNSNYTIHLTYRFEATIAFLPNLPQHMVEPMMLVGSSLILPPGPSQGQQFQVARASLEDAIKNDEKFTGVVGPIGGDPGWNDYQNGSSGGSVWEPHY